MNASPSSSLSVPGRSAESPGTRIHERHGTSPLWNSSRRFGHKGEKETIPGETYTAGPQSDPHDADRHKDDAIVVRVADGDERAVALLVDKYLNRIAANAYRILGNRDDADEVSQEVFLRVWKNARAWQPGRAKFSTWIYRVTVNLCLDRVRKRREVAMADPPDFADDRPSAPEQIQQNQTAAAVHEAMSGLPPRQVTALSLCYFDNLSNQEAADIMRISVDALESLLARGRRGLHQKLVHKREMLGIG